MTDPEDCVTAGLIAELDAPSESHKLQEAPLWVCERAAGQTPVHFLRCSQHTPARRPGG
jgi:hypothetical protein